MKRTRLFTFIVAIILFLCKNTSYAKEEDVYFPIPDGYEKISTINDDTIISADFTHYQIQKNEWGKNWKDYRGQDVDVFEFIKAQGINTVSVKICVNPDENSDNKYYSIDYAVLTLAEAKAAGLKTNAVLTFSDELTYKGHQPSPSAWIVDGGSDPEKDFELKAIDYVEGVLDKLSDEQVTPDIITIGNEISYDFLGLSGDDSWKNWSALAAVSKAIRDKDGTIKIAVGFAVPDSADGIKWYVDGDNNLNSAWCITQKDTISSAYDYVGISFYPTDVKNAYSGDIEYISDILDKYQAVQEGKGNTQPLILTGTNVQYVSEDVFEVDMYSQMDGLYDLLTCITSKGNAGGIVWNEADMCGGWSSLFADDGTAVPTMRMFTEITDPDDDMAVIDPYRFGGDTGMKDKDVVITKVPGMYESSIRGVDVSSCIALEEAGVKFYDNDGNEAPLFKVLSDNGVNYVRIRIWNDPYTTDGKTYGGGKCDLATGLEIAKRASQYNMKVLLCFQYSDFWSAPGYQLIPKGWQEYKNNPEVLSEKYYEYTKSAMEAFISTGVDIGMVQIGNEITYGVPGAHGAVNIDGKKYTIWSDENRSKTAVKYVSSGIKAVRETSPDTLVVLHLDSPEKDRVKMIMDTWATNDVDYDVLGVTIYPFWATDTKAQSPENLSVITKLAASYGKMCCVVETAWTQTTKDADGSANTIGENSDLAAFDVSPQGQVDMLTALYASVMAEENGLGAFYWEPAWIPIKSGWCHWKFNKETANIFGCGWASEGAWAPDDICEDGFFLKGKEYYNGEPTWGGTSWDNNTLFDTYGHPLKSLAFYRDAVSSGTQHIVKIQNVDEEGNRAGVNGFKKVFDNASANLSIPELEGYTFEGWFTDKECNTAFDTDTEINKDITIYARWKKNPEATPTAAPTETPTETPTPTLMPTPKATAEAKPTVTPKVNPTAAPDTPSVSKLKNTMSVKGKTIKVKKSRIRKKKLIFKRSKAIKVKKAKGKVSYKKIKGNRKIQINKSTGKVTIKKGLKKGTYKVKVKVTAAGNDKYDKLSQTVTFKVIVK